MPLALPSFSLKANISASIPLSYTLLIWLLSQITVQSVCKTRFTYKRRLTNQKEIHRFYVLNVTLIHPLPFMPRTNEIVQALIISCLNNGASCYLPLNSAFSNSSSTMPFGQDNYIIHKLRLSQVNRNAWSTYLSNFDPLFLILQKFLFTTGSSSNFLVWHRKPFTIQLLTNQSNPTFFSC